MEVVWMYTSLNYIAALQRDINIHLRLQFTLIKNNEIDIFSFFLIKEIKNLTNEKFS